MTVVWDMAQVRHSPLFHVFLPILDRIEWPTYTWPSLAHYQALIEAQAGVVRTGGGEVLRVVAQAAHKRGAGQQHYERRIFQTGELPTREGNWHDFFNVLAWVAFPQSKAILNARHVLPSRSATAETIEHARNPEQDALTQFDESGVVILSADPELTAMLCHFEWKNLFWVHRQRVMRSMRCVLFGHGLMEKAMHPYVGMTGKGMVIDVHPGFFAAPPQVQIRETDTRLVQCLADTDKFRRPGDLSPVPLLGFPGFTPANAVSTFYDNPDYFRAGRRKPCSRPGAKY